MPKVRFRTGALPTADQRSTLMRDTVVSDGPEARLARIYRKMICFAMRLGASDAQAEDIAAIVSEQIKAAPSPYVQTEVEFRRDVMRAIRNHMLGRRVLRVRRHDPESDDDFEAHAAAGDGPISFFVRSMPPPQETAVFLSQMRERVRKLPDRHRAIMALRMDGASILEISKETGEDAFNVATMLNECSEWINGPYLYEGKDAEAWRKSRSDALTVPQSTPISTNHDEYGNVDPVYGNSR